MPHQSCLLRGAGDRRQRPFAVGSPPYEGGRGEGGGEGGEEIGGGEFKGGKADNKNSYLFQDLMSRRRSDCKIARTD